MNQLYLHYPFNKIIFREFIPLSLIAVNFTDYIVFEDRFYCFDGILAQLIKNKTVLIHC